MDIQEGGWPLGLQPLNARIGLGMNADFSRSMSFSTIISCSPISSFSSSSDLDTESTGSFFHDRSITLGSLLGITSILELSGGSFDGRRRQASTRSRRNSRKTCATWSFFSLCARAGEAAAGKTPSLGHFLAAERKASGAHKRNRIPVTYELDGIAESQLVAESNSLFSNGCIAPPQHGVETGEWAGPNDERHHGDLGHANGYGIPFRFSCMGSCSP